MLRSRLRLTSSKLSSCGLACAEISSRQVPRKFAEKIFASARGEWARRSGATVSEDNKVQKQIGLCKPCVPLSTEGICRTKVHITKSEISMRTWRSPMSAASQGAFVVIPEISHSDISYIIKKSKWRFLRVFHKILTKRCEGFSLLLRQSL